MTNYRQGDVALKQLHRLPKGLKKLETLIVAQGEATGHHHKLVADRPETQIAIMEDIQGKKYIQIIGGQARLTHQEHDTIILQPGIFEVGIEREYDPVKEWRKVID